MNESKVIQFLPQPCALFVIGYFLLWSYPIDFRKILFAQFSLFLMGNPHTKGYPSDWDQQKLHAAFWIVPAAVPAAVPAGSFQAGRPAVFQRRSSAVPAGPWNVAGTALERR